MLPHTGRVSVCSAYTNFPNTSFFFASPVAGISWPRCFARLALSRVPAFGHSLRLTSLPLKQVSALTSWLTWFRCFMYFSVHRPTNSRPPQCTCRMAIRPRRSSCITSSASAVPEGLPLGVRVMHRTGKLHGGSSRTNEKHSRRQRPEVAHRRFTRSTSCQ